MTDQLKNARNKKSFRIKFESVADQVVDRYTVRTASVSSFATRSRGITRHKGSTKYITKLQRATKLEISFGSVQLDVAQIDRECPMARVTISRIYISKPDVEQSIMEIKIFYPILFQFYNTYFS